MEDIEFWVYIGKKVGINFESFKIIKDTSISNYKAIQENLNKTQLNLLSKCIDNQSEFLLVETHLLKLSKAICFQKSLITLKSLELFFTKLEAECNSEIKKTRIKVLVKVCKQVKKKLIQIQNPILVDLISFSIQQVNSYQYTLLGKL